MNTTRTLRLALEEWTDLDVAAYDLGIAVGLIDPQRSPFSTKAKHVFWSDNPVGNTLRDMLERLVTLGAIQRRDEPDVQQYRWNREHRGTWE